MEYFLVFLSTIILAVVFTLIVKYLAIKLKIVDRPILPRKIHKFPIPLLGGVAVALSFIIILFICSFFTDLVIKDFIQAKYIWGIIGASLIIILGGILDDKYNLPPKWQIFFPFIAVIIIIISGIGINHIRNPFGGIISFNNWQWVLFYYHGLPYKITLLADLFTFLWLMGMMYTTKLLDGLDGLVSGVTVIGALIIFGIAMNKNVAQYNTGLVALILAGAFSGFLIFNWHPAKIFLGEGGSLFAGLMLGVLSIISGSKVATTLLIMGIPILDVVWVVGRRIFSKKSVSVADRKHLHFRLLDVGFGHQQAVIFMLFLTGIFGSLSLFLQTFGKLIAFLILLGVMIILAVSLIVIYNRKNKIYDKP
jgi:UDP-GlcNAc:undecaprenyl-phosphate GlcNAc-1-phosphate transferase